MGGHFGLHGGVLQNDCARFGRHKAVLLRDVQEARCGRHFLCRNQTFQTHAVVAHGGVDPGGQRHHHREATAEAVAQRAHEFALALRHEPLACGVQIAHGLFLVHGHHQVDALLEFFGLGRVELDAGLAAREQVGHHHVEAFGGPGLRGGLHGGVDAEDFLDQHQRTACTLGAGHVQRGHRETV